jgi:hypothetical protein
MRRTAIIAVCIAVAMVGVLAIPTGAKAQFSPEGLLGVLTSPLRGALHGFGGLRPRHYRSRKAARPPARQNESKAGAAEQDHDDGAPQAFWATAHEDLLGYTFWPKDFDERLWSHGFGDIVDAMFSGGATAEAGDKVRTAAAASTTGSVNAVVPTKSACLSGATDAAGGNWPNERIAQMLDPGADKTLSEPQRAALAQLQASLTKAVNAIGGACPAAISEQPGERLRAMIDRLWAMRVAGYLVREPLLKFYDTLGPEQKAKFESESKDSEAVKAVQICGEASAARLPFRQIERVIRPNQEQRAKLAALEKSAEQTALSLRASCPKSAPRTPIARLDAALDRVDAMSYAAGTFAPAMGEFYGTLSDDQKARLASFGG